MFRLVRLILIVLALATTLLSIFAIIGSYKNEDYLTRIYLVDIHMTNFKLGKVLNLDKLGVSFDQEDILNKILDQFTYDKLGLSQVYSASFWGYCKGSVKGNDSSSHGFDNSNLNITWCSPAKAGYYLDPLEIFKKDMNSSLKNTDSGHHILDGVAKKYLGEIVDNLSYNSMGLPGNMQDNLTLLNNLTKAGFALLFITAILLVLFVVFQILGFIFDPRNLCYSCINFFFETLIFVCAAVGSALLTGAYYYVRRTFNNNLSDYGMKSFLSIAFYALCWSACASTIIILLFNLIAHCCGFTFRRNRYKSIQQPIDSNDIPREKL